MRRSAARQGAAAYVEQRGRDASNDTGHQERNDEGGKPLEIDLGLAKPSQCVSHR